mgnify:CR=1 FL=1
MDSVKKGKKGKKRKKERKERKKRKEKKRKKKERKEKKERKKEKKKNTKKKPNEQITRYSKDIKWSAVPLPCNVYLFKFVLFMHACSIDILLFFMSILFFISAGQRPR